VSRMAIVVGLHLRWDGVRQRPHHILSRLAERVPVVVVEEPFVIDAEERDELLHDAGVTIVRPVRKPLKDGPYVDPRAVETARGLIGDARALVWLYQPLMLALADAFEGPLVYDCMDDLAAFAFAPPQLRACERALLERADCVFCGGRTLFETRRRFGEKVRFVPSGVEFERFAAARKLAPHPAVAALPRPRWGYVGVIDERLDYALLDTLADAEENPQIVMIGPVAKVDARLLPRRANVHFTGKQPYASLPSMLAGLDLGLMPFARDDSTRAISPTKTLEYLAAGLPVVTTPIADVVADYGEVVIVAESSRFVRACAGLADGRAFPATASAGAERARRSARGIELAREYSWESIVHRMWSEIEERL
jgi:UDP-galactopyranose mutase